ncbi:MAG: helix-turn-helix transcriptional regulator [bacterium]|nr:helix-turn-helix transcriptional regulator [Candidatus Kapabacteria bacterium]
MAKIIRRTVNESAEELLQYEQVYSGQPAEARVRFLRILRTRPDLTFEQAADVAVVQHRSAYRWWNAYRTDGLAGLIRLAVGRPSKRGSQGKSSENAASAHFASRESALIEFLNGMPMQLVLLDGINSLRDRLTTLVPDVDRISIQVNLNCDLERPHEYHPNLSILQRADRAERLDEGMEVRALTKAETQSEELLSQMRRGGFPFELYREPISIDLLFEGTAVLGALVLWRNVDKSPISEETLAFIERINPFLVYAFSNLVTRHHYTNPGDRVFYSVLGEMAKSAKLTPQEQRIISYRLMGYSYKRIADDIDRSVDVVKKQLASVHRKTGTHGHSELFAKYFSPRLVPAK